MCCSTIVICLQEDFYYRLQQRRILLNIFKISVTLILYNVIKEYFVTCYCNKSTHTVPKATWISAQKPKLSRMEQMQWYDISICLCTQLHMYQTYNYTCIRHTYTVASAPTVTSLVFMQRLSLFLGQRH